MGLHCSLLSEVSTLRAKVADAEHARFSSESHHSSQLAALEARLAADARDALAYVTQAFFLLEFVTVVGLICAVRVCVVHAQY